MQLSVKRLTKEAQLPEKAYQGDAGFDIRCVADGRFSTLEAGWQRNNNIGIDYVRTLCEREDLALGDKVLLLLPGQSCLLHTGLSFAVPEGYCLVLKDRSGLASKHNLHILAGVIDQGFRNEVRVCIINLGEDTYAIKVLDKICQGLLLPVPQCSVTEVQELPSSDRGECGFGSTGV